MFLRVLEAKQRLGRYFKDLISSEKCITMLRVAITYGLDSRGGLVWFLKVKKFVF